MTFQERYKYNPTTDLLGKGGFARVYKATDTLLDREVAIKIFNATDQNHYTVVEEIKKVIKLKHPNLLTYYDVEVIVHTTPLGEKEVIQIGVMELANAGDLKQFALKNPNSPKLFQLLQQVLSGLEYLHQKGIIHRDLKPQNILLVEEDGELTAKISDFGISKNLEKSTSSSSMAIGTIEYMAPEQFNPAKYGINGKIGTNVDLWSFGIMVHELLTNESLFGQRDGSTTAEQIMSAILSNEIPTDLDRLPEPYRTATKQCLVKDARERIKKARDVISLLERKEQPMPQPVASTTNETVIIPKQYFDSQETSLLSNAGSVETQVVDKKNKGKNVSTSPKKWDRKRLLPILTMVFFFICAGIWWQTKENNLVNENKVPKKDRTLIDTKSTKKISTIKRQSFEPEMVFVKGDTLYRTQDNNCGTYIHKFKLTSFYIGKYEVTQKEWSEVMGSNPSKFKGDSLPVENVSWNDVQKYLAELNLKTGKSYRLPTVPEWEYAAKGGRSSKDQRFSGSYDISNVAWYSENSDNRPHQVGQKKPNELGIYDMTGNVTELTSDILMCDGKKAGYQLQGGSFESQEDDCTVLGRYFITSMRGNDSGTDSGLRLVLDSK